MKLPCFQPPDLGEFRIVYANQNIPSGEEGVAVHQIVKHYADNVVKTYKYEVWNFPAKNLFEQFRRVANFYFLCIVIVQFALRDRTPVSPMTSLLPLLFVIVVTAIKQGYEDWLRHKADREVNNRKVVVIKNSEEQDIYSKYLKVGDIVKVVDREEFPCDMVVISTSEGDGSDCSIMTANLDGETNLKARYSLQKTAHLNSPSKLSNFQARVECDHPEYDMYKFNGRMIFGDSTTAYSLDLSNLLLRGSKLMNTSFVYGLVVYTGKETKMALNQQSKKSKFSQVEKGLNTFLLIFLGLLIFEASICVIIKSLWEKTDAGKGWYLLESYNLDFQQVVIDLLSFLILFNYIIPISLYVTLELQKFCGAQFFNWDLELYHEPTDEPAKANTSDLNEELGQIEYVFSDKTGTLTENNMRFRQCSIGGIKYEEKDNKLFPIGQVHTGYDCSCLTEELKEFFIALALCHTAQANELSQDESIPDGCHLPTAFYNSKLYKYQASSPDEKALCEVSSRFGIIFKGKVNDFMELEVCGKLEKYKILHVLEFDSNRKRMSIILETPTKDIVMYCKGADSYVIPRCISGPCQETMVHIDKYAVEGLRTLAITSRSISYPLYKEINNMLLQAQNSITNRQELLAEAFDKLENDFHLLGASAVEDKLQDGVKETIESLREAGIKVWVLTGDKQETAVNISYSCAHFKQNMDVTYLTKKKTVSEVDVGLKEALKKIEVNLDDLSEKALVVDGSTLSLILKSGADKFLEFAQHCVAVLCCRMSPLQKAQVVRLVKESKFKPITLAIGDGANDCSMIQEAHVGCGIMGKEGRQAVRCSDYAFHRFRYLKRVLLVHGHNYYSRLATVVLYFFYKNIAFITPQFFFQLYNGYSGQPLYAGVFLTTFNILFTSMPILLYGIFEKDLKEETLMDHPILYRELVKNANLSWKKFAHWVLAGLWHAIVIFFGVKFVYGTTFISTMQDYSFFEFGVFVFTLVILITNLKIAFIIKFWTWFVHLFLWGSILLYVCIVLIISGVIWPWPGIRTTFKVPYDFSLYDSFYQLVVAWSFWLSLLIIVLLSLIPDIVLGVSGMHIRPTKTQLCQINDSDCSDISRGNKVSDMCMGDSLSMQSFSGNFEKDNVNLINFNRLK
ncbi:phospholipid-transporting ATPase IF isoform X3 [Hydra vulgaris]|uniref:Phospholipid-transporting ATPase n=1 Tax=Hydra vulgaris TaxID=6087 RepID=A0ABM4B460_HYDVU